MTWRTFSQFVAGGTCFALITYHGDAAKSHEQSTALAMRVLGSASEPAPESALDLAAMCRSKEAGEQAHAVARLLAALPQRPAAPRCTRGFK